MKSRGNGQPAEGGPPSAREVVPRKVARFSEVAESIRNGNDPEAFRRAAWICLEKAEVFAAQMTLYNTLKLAIEFHKHALFCEVAQDKTRTHHDTAAYEAYQKYLAGETSEPVAVGLVQGAVPETPKDVDADDEPEDDDAR